MELKSIKKFDRVLALVLTIAALLAGQSVWAASSFTVDIQSSSSSSCTFRITRTGNTAVSETIDWRVVSLSAIAGVHFTGYNGNYSGTVTFNVNDTYKDVTISESNPGDNAYKYQNGTTRSYRFEVLDRNGDILASCDRSRSYGTSVPSSGAFAEKDITIYTDEVQYSDAGYNKGNNPHYINSSSYYNLSGIAPVAYYTLIGAQLRSTLSFDAKEKNNGYQYVQVLINNTSTCDDRSDCSNGDPGNINLSRYMAGFDHDPGGKNTTYAAYTFPVLSAGNNCSTVTNAWSNGVDNKLYTQKFNTSCRATDGRLILPLDFNTLVVRFNASGGGTDNDEWYAKNVKAHIQAVDATAPTVQNNYKVSGGRHQKGNTVYVSVPFSEIVTVSGTPTLATSWGTLSYCAGSGSNVLTFSGTIASDATGTLSVTGHSGTITDLAGNALSGTVSHAFGTDLDDDYAWTAADFHSLGTNTYEIATKTDLRHLALLVNAAKNPCTGLTFRQTRDITCDATYIPIGYKVSSSDMAQFRGTYDGQGHTVSNITVERTGNTVADGYVGLFGYVHYNSSTDYGTVKNVVLANSTFTGYDKVGGIVGCIYNAIVENCRVDNTVTINAGHNGAIYHGGIVGDSDGSKAKIIGCYSAAAVSANGKSNCKDYGGIAGNNNKGTVKDCLYAGNTVTAANKKGAIIGFDDENKGVFSNNYYTAIDLGGVGADGSSSDRDGARRARTVSLGTGVALTGTQTAYDVSGLTAVGTTALSHNDGTATTIYSGEGQTVGLTITPAAGFNIGTVKYNDGTEDHIITPTNDAYSFTMPASDVTVSATFTTNDYENGHDGTADDPYVIYISDQLQLLAQRVNEGDNYSYQKHFKLGGDITFIDEDNNHTPIGTDDSNKQFLGTFDGGGFTISGIRISSSSDRVGLFSYVGTGGTVKNVTLADCDITGHRWVGGIVGFNKGTVTDCRVLGDVNIYGDANDALRHGGIAGQNNYGTVNGCYSAATVSRNGKSGCYNYGGIVGYNNSGTVSNSIAVGANVNGNDNNGAIVGRNDGGTLAGNYYHACTVGTTANATHAGTGSGDVTADDGAVQANAVLSESESVPDNLDGKVAFRREFTGGKASTICLPFALTDIEGGKAYEFVDVTYDAVDGWVATMNEVTATVANKPYLFLPEGSGSVPVLFHGTAGYDVSGGLATTSGDWTFTGTYTNLTYGTEPMTGHIYGFASKSKTVDGHDVEAGQFVHAKEGASVPPMRCYLTYKNGAQRAPMRASALGATGTDTDVPSRITVRLVSAGGTVTAVGTLDTVTGEMDINTWYDMNGRLLETEPTAPGLYIHNGKTIMIKE